MLVLVACRANVCRSRAAAALLTAPFAALGATVRSGGSSPAAPAVHCPQSEAFRVAAGVKDDDAPPRGIVAADLAAAGLVLASSRDVAAALVARDVGVRARVFTLPRAGAAAAWVAATLPGGPPGAPPLPPAAERDARWAWLAAEMDAARGQAPTDAAADVPDPHAGESDHAHALAAVQRACDELVAAVAAVVASP